MEQVYLLMGTSMLMGLTFGAIFALRNVGANISSLEDLRHELADSEDTAYPIAIVLGAIAGGVNQWMRSGQLPPGYA
eukprot:CAMPEP_0196789596 /NCGR_PEP_ID=MMETSP1104-20130614/26844_1 /TAXON_ID=33652 /ORGANISM="Cafeteria sp., Strain Caron Lab Isolate" /LENGTH=76 /DNA_ID=CAMNT_0042159957 /DNA_START=387 /DNA_END=613 /DNA_ORIENTATION=+